MERRETKYFAVERLTNTGRELQFYEHMEICCVEKGTAFVVVSGESEYLSEGQMVIIDPFENYSIEQLGEASILILSVGTSYLRYFFLPIPGQKASAVAHGCTVQQKALRCDPKMFGRSGWGAE